AGLSWRGVQDLERGIRRLPQAGTARRLAEALGLAGEHRAALLLAGRRGQGPTEPTPPAPTTPPEGAPRDPAPPAPQPTPRRRLRLVSGDDGGGTQGPKNTAAHNLPLPVSSFIGRDREVVELEQLLEATRLLTLTGAGGSGKTRLALHIAYRVQPRFNDGVW